MFRLAVAHIGAALFYVAVSCQIWNLVVTLCDKNLVL